MTGPQARLAGARVVWMAILAITVIPIIAAGNSAQLAWRDPIYIGAGFAGIAALALLFVQPLAAGGLLPSISPARSRRAHRLIGVAVFALCVIHVAGLWITSPPDVIDAFLFRSPTRFSAWGVIAFWAIFAAIGLARARKRFRPRTWRMVHFALVSIIVIGSVVHAVMIEGTMETVTKLLLCICTLGVTAKVIAGRVFR